MSAGSMPVGPDGRFSGYASVFGKLDQGGDIVMPGAFGKSLADKGRAGVRLLFQHDPKEPIGIWERVVEDGVGLWVEGRLNAGVLRARELSSLIAGGAIDGLSIGFRTVRATKDRATGHRRLWQVDLWEISIVTFPMMDGARITARADEVDTVRLKRSLDAAVSLFRA